MWSWCNVSGISTYVYDIISTYYRYFPLYSLYIIATMLRCHDESSVSWCSVGEISRFAMHRSIFPETKLSRFLYSMHLNIPPNISRFHDFQLVAYTPLCNSSATLIRPTYHDFWLCIVSRMLKFCDVSPVDYRDFTKHHLDNSTFVMTYIVWDLWCIVIGISRFLDWSQYIVSIISIFLCTSRLSVQWDVAIYRNGSLVK